MPGVQTWMKDARSGGHEQGIFTTCPASFVVPSQSPVPVGFTPDCIPKSGTRAASIPLFGDAGVGTATCRGLVTSVPSWMAFCWARYVVEAAGHPTPGPSRFCKVTNDAWILASLSSFEEPVGKETLIPRLLTAWPALTFAFRDLHHASQSIQIGFELSDREEHTWIKIVLSGGQEQGILTICPASLVIPSQSPVPVGLTPDWTPNSGTSDGSTSRFMGTLETEIMIESVAKTVVMNFIFYVRQLSPCAKYLQINDSKK